MSYRYKVLADKPVGMWPFDTSGTLISDISGNSKDATVQPLLNLLSNPSFESNTTGWSTLDLCLGNIAQFTPDTGNSVTNPSAVTDETNGATLNQSDVNVAATRITGSGNPEFDTAHEMTRTAAARTWSYIFLPIGTKPAAGETWTLSFWFRAPSGSTSVSAGIMDGSASNQTIPFGQTVAATTSWQLYTYTAVAATGTTTTSNLFYINTTNISAALTIDITGVQLVKGTSRITQIAKAGTKVLSAQAGGAWTRQSVNPLTEYTASAYVFPPAAGIYGVYSVKSPPTSSEQGPTRRYSIVKNGPGAFVEEPSTNLIPNPNFATSNGWTALGATANISLDATVSYNGTQSLKVVRATTADSRLVRMSYAPADAWAVFLSPGTYTVSCWIRGLSSNNSTSARIEFENNGSPYAPGTVTTTVTAPFDGTWHRAYQIFTVTATGTVVLNITTNTNGAVGDTFWVDAAQLEKLSYPTSYIDGGLGTGYSWDTTTNIWAAEDSSFEGGTIGGWASGFSSLANATDSALFGTHSLKGVRGSGDTDPTNFAYLGATLSQSTYYTVSAWIRCSAAAYIRIGDDGSFGLSPGSSGYQPVQANQWTRVVWTYQTNTDVSGVHVFRASADTSGTPLPVGTSIWLDGALLERRSYPTPYTQSGVANAISSTRAAGYLSFPVSIPAGSATIIGTIRVGAPASGSSRDYTRILSLSDNNYGNNQSITHWAGNTVHLEASGNDRVISGLNVGDIITVAISTDVTGATVYYSSLNGGAVGSTPATGSPIGARTRVNLYAADYLVENIMAFNSALSSTDVSKILLGTTAPSVAASRSDCVFSAFVNDGPVASTSLPSQQWSRVTSTKTTLPDESQSDIVVIGPNGSYSGPVFMDAVDFVEGSSTQPYFDTTQTYTIQSCEPIVAKGIGAVRLTSDDKISFPIDGFMIKGKEGKPFTLEAWIKPQSYSDSAWLFRRNVSGIQVSGNTVSLVLHMNSVLTASWSGLTLGDTYHIVAEYDGFNAYLYVNDVLESTVEITPTDFSTGFQYDTGSVLYMAAYGANSIVVDGAAVYSYPLHSDRVDSHFSEGTDYPDVRRVSGFNNSHQYEIWDGNATVFDQVLADDATSWNRGTFTGNATVVNDQLVNFYSDTTSQYEAGTWLLAHPLEAQAVTLAGSRITWDSNITGLTVAVSTDGGTTWSSAINGGSPIGALDLSTARTIVVRVTFAAGTTQTTVSKVNLVLYSSKNQAGTNSSNPITIQGPLNVTLAEFDYDEASFNDNLGAYLSGTGTRLDIPADSVFGGYQAIEMAVKITSATPNVTVMSGNAASYQPIITTDANGNWVQVNCTSIFLDGAAQNMANPITITPNVWHHVIVVFPATSATFYIGNNGALTSGYPVRIGYLSTMFQQITSIMADRIYKGWVGETPLRVTDSQTVTVSDHVLVNGNPVRAYAYNWSVSSGG